MDNIFGPGGVIGGGIGNLFGWNQPQPASPNQSTVPINYTPVPYGTESGNLNYVQTGPTTGAWSPTPATPVPGGSVAGVSTGGNVSPPAPTIDTSSEDALINEYIKRGWNDIGSIKGDIASGGYKSWGGGGGGAPSAPSGPSEADISGVFDPYSTALSGQETSAQTSAQTALGNIGTDYQNYSTQFGQEEAGLRAGQAEQERLVGEAGTSAADEARRSYNALIQQGRSRFGAGSSAGGAIGEIAAQEFARSQGKLGQAQVGAQQALSLGSGKLDTFISQKKSDLLKWKTDAETQIKNNLQASLQNINLRRGEIESAKASARINSINQARADLQAIQNADNNVRQGLASFAIQNAQEIAGRTLTPQEIMPIWNSFMNVQLQGVGAATNPTVTASILGGRGTKDQFGNLINPLQ